MVLTPFDYLPEKKKQELARGLREYYEKNAERYPNIGRVVDRMQRKEKHKTFWDRLFGKKS